MNGKENVRRDKKKEPEVLSSGRFLGDDYFDRRNIPDVFTFSQLLGIDLYVSNFECVVSQSLGHDLGNVNGARDNHPSCFQDNVPALSELYHCGHRVAHNRFLPDENVVRR